MKVKFDAVFREVFACFPAGIAVLDSKYGQHAPLVQISEQIVQSGFRSGLGINPLHNHRAIQ